MASLSIRQIHWVLSATLGAAVGWEWIRSHQPTSQRSHGSDGRSPSLPTAADAARIVDAAWAKDGPWGTLVGLVMVTGMRREWVFAMRWFDVDLVGGMLVL